MILVLIQCQKNETIVNNYTKAWYIINKDKYKKNNGKH